MAVSIRHHQQKWGRFLLTILGVIIAVAVSSAIRSTNDRVLHSFSRSLENLSGNSNLQLRQEGGMDLQQLWEVNYLWDYGSFSPFVQISMEHKGQSVELFAFDFLGDQQIRTFQTQSHVNQEMKFGLWLPIDSPLLQEKSPLSFVVAGKTVTFPVAGTLKGINGRLPPKGSAFIDLDQIRFLGLRISGLDIWVKNESLEAVKQRLQHQFPSAQVITLSNKQKFTEEMLSAFQMNLGALGLIALFVSSYLVYNSLNLAVLERRVDLNILCALGAHTKEIFWALITEGFLIGILGGAIGAVFGWLLSQYSYGEVSQSVTNLFHLQDARLPFFDWQGPLISWHLGILSCLAAAWLPAYRAMHVQTAAGLKNKVSEFQARKGIQAGLFGGLLLLVGCIFIGIALFYRITWPGFAAIFFLLLGLSFLAPLCLMCVIYLLRSSQGVGLLVRSSLQSHLFKLSVAIAALTVSLSMAGSISMMVYSFRDTLTHWLDITLQADIYVKSESLSSTATGRLPLSLEAKIKDLPFVKTVLPLYLSRTYVHGLEVDLGANQFDQPEFQKTFRFLSQIKHPFQGAKNHQGLFISEVLAEKTGLTTGDGITLFGQLFTICAVYQNFSSQRGMIYLDRSTYLHHLPQSQPAGIGIYLKSGVEKQQALLALRSATEPLRLTYLFSQELKQKALSVFDQTFRLTRLLQAVAFGISILAVIASLSTIIIERRSELALLYALGARKPRVLLGLFAESLSLAGSALLLSSFGAWSLSWVLIQVINRFSYGWTILSVTPWFDLLQTAVLIILGALLATLGPVRILGQLKLDRLLNSKG